jgi:hypothetical protein
MTTTDPATAGYADLTVALRGHLIRPADLGYDSARAVGVVTSFVSRCHDIGDNGVIVGGPVLYRQRPRPSGRPFHRHLAEEA